MRVYFVVLATVTCFLLTGASFGPQVTVHSGMLTVRAKRVPLVEVLAAVSDQAKVKFTVVGEWKVDEVLISDDFAGLPLERGIARLLRGVSYSLIGDKAGALRKVVILGRGTSAGSTRNDAAYAAPAGSEAPDNTPAVSEGPEEAESHETSSPPETTEDRLAEAITAAKAAQNPDEQVDALLKLGDYQDNRALGALTPALQSPHAAVRSAALEAMRRGTVQEPSALIDVRRMASHDPDQEVRRSALEVIVRYDKTPEGRALLERLTAGGDEALRDFATRELGRMDEEAAEAGADTDQAKVNQ